MAVKDFVIDLIEGMLADKDLGLSEQDIRFYDKGTTAGADEDLDNHVRWKNARYYNEDSNVVRSSLLIVQIPIEKGEEYVNFHVGELYRLYRKDGMKGVLPIVKNDISGVKAASAQTFSLISKFGDFEAIKENLIVRPLNYDNNEKVLENGIYRKIGDMALVLYISMGVTMSGSSRNIMSTMVQRVMFKEWNVDEQETFDWALENTMRLQPPVLCQLTSVVGNSDKLKTIEFMDDDSVKVDFNQSFAPSLTTKQEVNGAIAAFYPGVLERLYQMVGEDFYLVFTSIYDLHVHPVNGSFGLSAMRKSLKGTNQNVNRRDEIFTRKIYRYNGETKEITEV